MSYKSVLKVLLALVLVFASNAFFVHPREVVNDSTALLQMLQREQHQRDVKRQGALLVTPTRVALGEDVEVVVEDISGRTRALVMIDSFGETLDVRHDPLGSQVFTIPENGNAGDYRFWLAWADLQAQSGLGVISVEVYDPIPGNLRHAEPLVVAQTFVSAVQQLDSVLAGTCFVPDFFAGTDGWRWLFPEAIITWNRGEVLFREVIEEVETRVLVLVHVDVVRSEGVITVDTFWGVGAVQRYAVLVPTSTGWRISEWLTERPRDMMPPQAPAVPIITDGGALAPGAEEGDISGVENQAYGDDASPNGTDLPVGNDELPLGPLAEDEGSSNEEGNMDDPSFVPEGEEEILAIPG